MIARSITFAVALCCLPVLPTGALANAYREKAKPVEVAGSGIMLTPPRDWNRLGVKPAKYAETWTLDGEQLNDATFFGGVEPGKPLVREHNRKREPLPYYRSGTLLIEVPELLGNTYRAYKHISSFTVTSTRASPFLGKDGVVFTYDYIDQDELPRRGEGRATVIGNKLYMATYDAPRLHYFERNIQDFRALVDTASIRR